MLESFPEAYMAVLLKCTSVNNNAGFRCDMLRLVIRCDMLRLVKLILQCLSHRWMLSSAENLNAYPQPLGLLFL